ncbi:DNA (cytosine-5)-methyltransferase [Spiroplasma helicoides]|uniref:Cytosine-specific methyltransferase n=1 Tax=Spiroplasma helicoides TaxID=216938 RepID=A0A1B3SK59_9MOLU|nr:DNA (cytosine-5-)-methyltransferase [Spiroplasma helicoides]AOG60308.1 DNA (cytosine-5)-methyltransferase [Spiroplasma helicoides]
MKKLKVFETFAGIGAQHKALSIIKKNNKGSFDFEVSGTSEWDVWANISYDKIHNENKKLANLNNDLEDTLDFLGKFTHSMDSKKPISFNSFKNKEFKLLQNLELSMKNSNNQGSIVEIKAKDLLKNIGDFDILTYSFPCQDLSVAGSFHGFNQGMKKGSGTRSGLLWEIERILKGLHKLNKLPKFLLLENVKNMISERHKEDYIDWLNFLHSIGYNTQTYLLNSLNYGIPQSRERVYALSVLNAKDFRDTFIDTKSIIEKCNIPKDVSTKYGINKTIKDVLKVNYDDKLERMEAIEARPNKTPSRKRMYNGNPVLFTKRKSEVLKYKNRKYEEYENGFYLSNSRTVTTKQDRHPNAGVIDLKGTSLESEKLSGKANYRFLTPRETFLLMGFDDDDFDKTLKNDIIKKEILYRQAGNSIVVNVLVAIFDMLKDVK